MYLRTARPNLALRSMSCQNYFFVLSCVFCHRWHQPCSVHGINAGLVSCNVDAPKQYNDILASCAPPGYNSEVAHPACRKRRISGSNENPSTGDEATDLQFAFLTGLKQIAACSLPDFDCACDMNRHVTAACRAFIPRRYALPQLVAAVCELGNESVALHAA